MKNQKQRANRRNVSVEKLQDIFVKLCTELASGQKSMPIGRTDNAIIIYANGGTVKAQFENLGDLVKILIFVA